MLRICQSKVKAVLIMFKVAEKGLEKIIKSVYKCLKCFKMFKIVKSIQSGLQMLKKFRNIENYLTKFFKSF